MSNNSKGPFMQVMEKYTKSLKAFISAQGFGHYSKPSGGIPKSDLEQSVQNSLGKADTALQTFTESDPTVPSWAKASSKPSYTQDEVGDGTTYKRVSATEKNTWNNKGTYSKPSGGIPKTDLASAVQTSLGKADSALQSETDPTVPSWAKASTKPTYTASEVGAVPNTAAGVSAAINQLTTGDSAPTDNDYYVSQYAGGGTSTTTYHRRPVSKLWEYIKSKLASKGSATQPVYFSNGLPVATTYTLGKSVPSDAKFTDTTYSAATTSAAGLMSAADKSKLDGIATGATKTTVDSALSSTSTNPVQNKVINTALSAKIGAKSANGYWGLASPNGTDTEWTRTSTQGIIPYQSGSAGSGHQSIGTSGWYFSHAYVDNFHGYLDGNAKTADKLKIKSVKGQAIPLKAWTTKTWSGLTRFIGENVWTDGTNVYYSYGSDQYVLNGSTWTTKAWSGLTSFNGYQVWTDGTNVYYSYASEQYVLNGSTWSTKTWSGLTSFYGTNVWTDGGSIYYSRGSTQYVLNGSTWTKKSWTGLTNFYSKDVWSDGTNTYYSEGGTQYVLNGSTWTKKSWTGLTSFNGTNVWTDGTNVYYSDSSSTQYVLDKANSVWRPKTWSWTPAAATFIWTDGTNVYYSSGTTQYILTENNLR